MTMSHPIQASPPVHTHLIQQRIAQIQAAIPAHVQIMAVSKGYTPAHIRAAYQAGLRHFGESRVQEAMGKRPHLQDCPEITWHLIGHLQTNKVKQALELFQWIDSVDSYRLAQLLDQKAAGMAIRPQVCLQVKLAPDPNKYGWPVPDLMADLPELDQLTHLDIQGLMTILPQGLAAPEVRSLFGSLTDLAAQIRTQSHIHLDPQVLSMGMSGDYLEAIAAGSTQIRLGRSLFAGS